MNITGPYHYKLLFLIYKMFFSKSVANNWLWRINDNNGFLHPFINTCFHDRPICLLYMLCCFPIWNVWLPQSTWRRVFIIDKNYWKHLKCIIWKINFLIEIYKIVFPIKFIHRTLKNTEFLFCYNSKLIAHRLWIPDSKISYKFLTF